jgi:hypothetical protein
MADEYESSFSMFVSADIDINADREDATERSPVVRRSVHRALVSLGRVDEFLHERNVVLADEAKLIFLDALEGEFLPALATLRRRADGNYERDKRPESFPAVDPSVARQAVQAGVKPVGLTVWAAFELWIAERQPAASSVNRWRAVFNGLRETFGDRDLSSITLNEAQEWIDGLTTANRSAHVVNDVWLRAVRTVFRWAVSRNRLASDPFAGATVALPKKLPRLREREFHEAEWRTILSATLQPPPARMEPHNGPQPGAVGEWPVFAHCGRGSSRGSAAAQPRGGESAQGSVYLRYTLRERSRDNPFTLG